MNLQQCDIFFFSITSFISRDTAFCNPTVRADHPVSVCLSVFSLSVCLLVFLFLYFFLFFLFPSLLFNPPRLFMLSFCQSNTVCLSVSLFPCVRLSLCFLLFSSFSFLLFLYPTLFCLLFLLFSPIA